MKRRASRPCCPTCGRAIPQPKPPLERVLLERLCREAFVALAFAAPEWHAVRGTWGRPRRGRGIDMQPAVMSTGTTAEPDTGAWEQTDLATAPPRYRRPEAPRDAQTGCSDEAPCALHRGRVAA